ncbi:hypothetical protein GH733_014791, partial [Mirounga leonina]
METADEALDAMDAAAAEAEDQSEGKTCMRIRDESNPIYFLGQMPLEDHSRFCQTFTGPIFGPGGTANANLAANFGAIGLFWV